MITALAALLVAGALFWLGRRDVTHPAVAFGVPWYGFLALAQLRLTNVERPWSMAFTLVAFGGGLAFVVASTLAAGTAPARGTIHVDRERVDARRLIIAAVILIAGGAFGAIYKAHLIHGVPLLSSNPDLVRGRALGGLLPSWSSALTGGFYIGMWVLLAATWVLAPRVRRLRLVPLWLLTAVALFGVALEASRNLVVFALVVPALGAYLLSEPGPRRAALARGGGAVLVLVLGVGGLFALRIATGHNQAHDYVTRQAARQPPPIRPLMPLYISAAFPLEADRRVFEAVPTRLPYEFGATSLTSLPDKAFPKGKPGYGREVANLMVAGGAAGVSWTVASYQGRLLADLGWPGVLLGSLLLGLGFGTLFRWARGRIGFLPIAVIAYFAYYSAYMVYDNALSFSVIAIYDLGVIALVSAYGLRRTDGAVARLGQLGRGRPAS